MDVIVDTRKQDRLVAEGDARTGEAVAGLGQLEGDLVGVVDMDVEPERVILLKHVAEVVIHPHRHEDRDARTDADDLDVLDLAQPAEQLRQQLGGQHQGIAAGKEDVPHLGRSFEIVDLHVELGARELLARLAHDARARAVAAVGSALSRDQHQHSIRVAVHEARYRRVRILRQRIFHHGGERFEFRGGRDHLSAHGVVGIGRVDQRDEVRRDVHPEQVGGRQSFRLALGELEDLSDLVRRVEAMAELPAPTVPLIVRNVGVQRGSPRGK